LITYLNDRDWMLRAAFFESIVGVATFVGGRNMEEYILPLLTQAITGTIPPPIWFAIFSPLPRYPVSIFPHFDKLAGVGTVTDFRYGGVCD